MRPQADLALEAGAGDGRASGAPVAANAAGRGLGKGEELRGEARRLRRSFSQEIGVVQRVAPGM